MRRTHLFLLSLLWLAPAIANAQPSAQYDAPIPKQALPPLATFYLKDLEELGYCVIPNVFSTSETKRLYERVWLEYIEKAWPSCKMDDSRRWENTFPIHQQSGIFCGPAGQIQVMWDLRQDPRIVEVFEQVWNTSDLIVSMDGLCLMCPQEIRESNFDPWPHVDQAVLRRQDNVAHDNNSSADFVSESLLTTNPFTIQGQFLFEDSFDGDGGFYCIPKSHLKFKEFAPQLEEFSQGPQSEAAYFKYLLDFFDHATDESGNPYCKKQIMAPRGSLILWDSRTVHWNQHANKDRPYSDHPKIRMVGYLCYVPKTRLTEENRLLRIQIFEEGVSTGHNPACPEPKRSRDHIWQEFKQHLEDPGYVQPKIHLTPLGESLLGL